MKRRAGATRADAGRLRQLLSGAAGGGELRPAQSAGAPQLMVRILADIAAGDYSQQDAAIMTISGSTLTDTLQRVNVRHVGEGSVAAGTIVFPELCGQHGLAFVRTSNGQPVVGIGVNRFAKLVGPIAGELSGANAENTDWTLGSTTSQNWLNDNGGFTHSGYFAEFSLGSTPTTAGSGTPPTQPWTETSWVLRMKALRFKVDPQVDNPFNWASNLSAPAGQSVLTSWYMNPIRQLQSSFGDIGPSGRTVKSGSWLHAMTIDSVAVPTSGAAFTTALTGNFSELKVPRSLTYAIDCSVRFVRVWIDGVDRTGVISPSLGFTFPASPNSNLANSRAPLCGQQALAQLTSAAALADKTVEFDVWLRYTVRFSGAAPGSGDFWGTPKRSIAVVMPDCRGLPVTLYTANAFNNFSPGKVWEFAFSANGPGGVSTIQNREQAGWSYAPTTAGFVLSTTSGTFGQLSMNYLREIPLIRVRNSGADDGLYVPDDDAHFDNITLYNGQQWKPGVWNPNAATTFRLVGTTADGSTQSFMGLRALAPSASFWGNLPETITVTPV